MAAGEANIVVSVEDLQIHFPSSRRRTVKAVDGVSFSVQRGETFGIIGESGSGKTTLGRAVVGLLKPTAGKIRLYEGASRRDYQIIFQDPHSALNPRMTILDSVREPLIIWSTPRKEIARKSVEALERVGLGSEFAERYPHELSGGQKQRVNIARALTLNPKLLVCDEIVAALDVSIQAEILNLLAELQRELDLTYLFITHDLGVVAHVSDRIAVMYLGWFVELGDGAEISQRPLHPYTEALLSADPQPYPSDMRTGRRIILEGEIPSPISPPSGCRFRTRCRYATERCAAEVPAFREIERGRHVACHYAGELDLGYRAETGEKEEGSRWRSTAAPALS